MKAACCCSGDIEAELGLIQPSSSAWANSIFFVLKKPCEWHFCVVYRKMNSEIVFDSFLIPCMDKLQECISMAKYISTINLTKGYWQIPLDFDAQLKRAFITSDGQFEFLVMLFRMKNAVAIFTR